MFGYTVPMYRRMSSAELGAYQRYYCETCHHLREGFGLVSTAAVSYDMTFNTIVLNSLSGDVLDFPGTPKSPGCVFKSPGADSDLFRQMAAYTVLLTKWELYDDRVDSPSMKTSLADLALGRAIRRAEGLHPDFDDIVGKGFENLRSLESQGCTDAVRMGTEFGKALTKPLSSAAGDADSPELRRLFTKLAAAVYVMDAVDDLEEDFVAGTYNPFINGKMFVNRDDFMRENVYAIAETIGGIMSDLQRAYAGVRKGLRDMTGVCDNIAYLGIPESARKAVEGRGAARLSIKNVLDERRARTATYRGGKVIPARAGTLGHAGIGGIDAHLTGVKTNRSATADGDIPRGVKRLGGTPCPVRWGQRRPPSTPSSPSSRGTGYLPGGVSASDSIVDEDLISHRIRTGAETPDTCWSSP